MSDDESSGASSAQLAADQAALTSDNDSLDQAITALAGASLVAPFNGEVAQVNVTAGEQLSSGGTGGTSLTGSSERIGEVLVVDRLEQFLGHRHRRRRCGFRLRDRRGR